MFNVFYNTSSGAIVAYSGDGAAAPTDAPAGCTILTLPSAVDLTNQIVNTSTQALQSVSA